MPSGVGVAGLLAFALAACSAPADDTVVPPSGDEQKAVADARAMIPASELPTETATPATQESPAR